MPKIHELSSVLANQIAAGEVVERPASVVKELVENSIDAKSNEIDITVEESGLKSIQVIDDGVGINHSDVRNAFKRHATSKITDREDLFQVRSLGFRGEALPSIASVADVNIKTSTGGEGTLLHIKGGKVIDEEPSDARQGTDIVVKNLFFNTPARLKYMKSPATELSKITDIVYRLAVGHPDISFSLIHNHRELLRTSGRGNMQQVIGAIYGIQSVRKMVAFKNENDDFKIDGYVSLPELNRASRHYISIILNGRAIDNSDIAKAILHGYGSKLMVGRYPIAVINIKADPLLIDANVHPTKQDVRISKENELSTLISKTVFNVLSKQTLIPDALHKNSHVKPRYKNINQLNMDLNQASDHYSNHHLTRSDDLNSDKLVSKDTNLKSNPVLNQNNNDATVIIHTKSDLKQPILKQFAHHFNYEHGILPFSDEKQSYQTPSSSLDNNKGASDETRFPNLVYVGQIRNSYLIAEGSDGMYILDQHAAQERINYEYYRKQIGNVSNDEQNLLVPTILNYSTSDTLKINQNLDVLKAVGINLESFGKNSFIVRQHPTWFKSGEEESTIKEMIDWVLNHGKISIASFRAKTAIMMSCKRAIKAHQHLDGKQARSLIEKLKTCEDPFNCPHGRPILVHFTTNDLEKMFKRIQDPHHSASY